MCNLEFTFILKEHPYSYENTSKHEIWGQIYLSCNSENIISHEWDVLEIIEWFMEKSSNLLHDKPIIDSKICIAAMREHLYAETDIDETPDEYYEELADYFSNHVFHIRGTNTGYYYIGLTFNEVGEISFKINNRYNLYYFDMKTFIDNTYNAIRTFIQHWNKSIYKTDENSQRVSNIQRHYNVNII